MKIKRVKLWALILILISIVFFSFNYLNSSYIDNGIKKLIGVDDYSKDSEYKVIFDANGGNLASFLEYDLLREGVYGTNHLTGQPDFVSQSKKDNHYILYWSKDHKCSTKDLEVGANFELSTHTVYYACYEETNFDNGGIRYIQEGAYVSGEMVACGDNVRVTECYKKFGGTGRDFGYKEYCEFDQKNGKSASGEVYRMQLAIEPVKSCKQRYTAYFHESSEDISGYGLECGSIDYYSDGVCNTSQVKGGYINTPDTSKLTSGDNKFIGWAADDDGKNINCSGKLITDDQIVINNDVHYYACYEKEEKCESTEKIKNGKGSYKIKVCYNTTKKYGEYSLKPINNDYDEILECASGYKLDDVSKSNIIETTCKKEGACYQIYDLSCVGERPKISAQLGIVGTDGTGTIKFSATSSSGIKGWYASENYMKPTTKTDWILSSKGEYSLNTTPGTMFLWVIDNNNQISYAAMSSVIDKVNTDTTLKTLEIKGDNGETLNPQVYAYDNVETYSVTSSDYVRLSNKLDNKVSASRFNPFDTAYKVTTSSEKIAVYATLTSNDASYIAGYEPREVELDYGVNTILIKIQNKKGKVRTYTIIVTREDDREGNNYLKSLNISEGKINFSKYTDDYVVSISKNKKSVSISGELESLNSSFVDGFGPRTIKLNDDTTTVALKVKSESGSIRAYTITFVKNGDETNEKSEALLHSLSLSKSHIAFDKEVLDYNTTVGYEIDTIDIYALAENGGDSVSLYRTINGVTAKIESKDIALSVGDNIITIIVSSKEGKSRTYTINILRKENGLVISSDTSLSMLVVDGYNIAFDPEKTNYEIKIKREKTLVIAATPMNNRAEVYIRGNDNLTAFSIVKIKVVSEDGHFKEYTIDIKKDTFNKTIEMISIIGGVFIIICGIIIIKIKRKRKSINSYYA